MYWSIAKLFLAGRIAQLLTWVAGVLVTVGISFTSQDGFVGASNIIAGLVITAVSYFFNDIVHRQMIATPPPVPPLPESSASTLSSKTKIP